MKKTFHKHINMLQAFAVIPMTVNCALPTMWKSTNTIGFTMAEVCAMAMSSRVRNLLDPRLAGSNPAGVDGFFQSLIS